MIIALARLNHASYEPALWQGKFVYWCVMAVAILVNVYTSKILPKLESFILVLHIGGFIAVLVPLVVVCIQLFRDVWCGGGTYEKEEGLILQVDVEGEGFDEGRVHCI